MAPFEKPLYLSRIVTAQSSSFGHDRISSTSDRKSFQFTPDLAPSDIGASLVSSLIEATEHRSLIGTALICVSHTSDWNNPGLSSFVLGKLKLQGIPNFEFRQLGTGLSSAMEVAHALLHSEIYDSVILLVLDCFSRAYAAIPFDVRVEESEQKLAKECFGDGGGALLLTASAGAHSVYTAQSASFAAPLCAPSEFVEWVGVEAPSSGRLPERLGLKDYTSGLHLPVLREAVLLEDIERIFHSPERFDAACGKTVFLAGPTPRASALLATKFASIGASVEDTFPRYGYTGSIGPLLAVAETEACDGMVFSLGVGGAWSLMEVTQC